MPTFSGSIHGGPLPRRAVIALMLFSLVHNAAFAADSTSAQRFQLSGSGTLTMDQPVQKNGNLRLKAYMTSQEAQLAAMTPVQEGGGFALIASVNAVQSVCYNDTIFRDDFDADGF